MDKKLCYILGSIFIISSGLLYTMERFISYFSWTGQMIKGSFPTESDLPTLFTNVFVPAFFVIGAILFFRGYKNK